MDEASRGGDDVTAIGDEGYRCSVLNGGLGVGFGFGKCELRAAWGREGQGFFGFNKPPARDYDGWSRGR
jgi:hypothetical protein